MKLHAYSFQHEPYADLRKTVPVIRVKDVAVAKGLTHGHFITAKVAIRNASGFVAKSVGGKPY